jgi:hypothetical protein
MTTQESICSCHVEDSSVALHVSRRSQPKALVVLNFSLCLNHWLPVGPALDMSLVSVASESLWGSESVTGTEADRASRATGAHASEQLTGESEEGAAQRKRKPPLLSLKV